MNKVILIGRLTKDPELRYTPGSGVAVATFTLAVSRPFLNQKGERDTDFIPIVVWRKLAEQCASNLRKGRLVGVSGRLQVRSFETQNGTRKWVTEVVAEEIQFLDRPKATDSQEREPEPQTGAFEEGFNDPDIDLNFDFDEDLNAGEDLPF
ncbi:single-stranded DNA-binding protein [Thermovenabulum gondwanense]|uniref:Single-stranded DNA-binding protein n=2 Tax=Thermovenabulum TaxID=159730 RepID=A0A161QCQ8_9FIRM|nr:single-stranded DNA-binding protein [Thermovenabulum gondwanense]KYO67224.1 Single-stranded DNA-binding protein A [Thermovenabulum gondwanense]